MEITTLQIVLVFIVACIAGMESVLDEFQFHRPLVACTLIGAVLGDMKTGIIIGGTLEMIALGWMNIGAAVAPDAALASIISTVLVIAGHPKHRCGYRPGNSTGRSWPGSDHYRSYHHRCFPACGR
ncbi:PTS system mannose/fructose/sorbose family transporter subunit IIC [Lelliottia amnigena]|nr:PTS system mannose/fructose/sorbose family transporter subunit IIC [Lelliottia amnigena]